MKRKVILTSGVLALLSLVGCGGGGGSTLVNPSLVVNWAERTRAINAPSSAQSVKITLDSPQPSVADVVWVINRGSNLAAFSQSYTSPEQVRSGVWNMRVELFSEPSGQGTEVGEGGLSVVLRNTGAFQTPEGAPVTNVAIDRKIQSVTMGGFTVQEEAAVELTAAAFDAEGSLVPVTQGAFKFAPVTGAANLNLRSDGILIGAVAGRSTVAASVDGITSTPANISVTPLPANYIRTVNQGFNDVVLAGNGQFLLASSRTANQIVKIDAATGATEVWAALPFTPDALALSADGEVLYVGARATDQVAKLSTADRSVLWTTNLGAGTFSFFSTLPLDIDVDPSNADRWVVSVGYSGVSPAEDRVRVYSGQTREATANFNAYASRVFFNGSSSELVTFNESTSEFGTRRLTISGDTITETQRVNGLIFFGNVSVHKLGNYLLFTDGLIVNSLNLTTVGNVPLPGSLQSGWRAVANPASDRATTARVNGAGPSNQTRLSNGAALVTNQIEIASSGKLKPLENGGTVLWDANRLVYLRPVADF